MMQCFVCWDCVERVSNDNNGSRLTLTTVGPSLHTRTHKKTTKHTQTHPPPHQPNNISTLEPLKCKRIRRHEQTPIRPHSQNIHTRTSGRQQPEIYPTNMYSPCPTHTPPTQPENSTLHDAPMSGPRSKDAKYTHFKTKKYVNQSCIHFLSSFFFLGR